jgi:hypothetical protein
MAKIPARKSLKRKNRDVSNDEDRKSPPEEIKVATVATVVETVVNDPSKFLKQPSISHISQMCEILCILGISDEHISSDCVMIEHQGNLVDKTHDKAFVGHGEVPRASFMDDTVIDLPDYDEQGNNTNADNVVS